MNYKVAIIDDKNVSPEYLSRFLISFGLVPEEILVVQNLSDWNPSKLLDVKLVFLDHHLGSDWTGQDVVNDLSQRGFEGHIVGISQGGEGTQGDYLGAGSNYLGITTECPGALVAVNPIFVREKLSDLGLIPNENEDRGIN